MLRFLAVCALLAASPAVAQTVALGPESAVVYRAADERSTWEGRAPLSALVLGSADLTSLADLPDLSGLEGLSLSATVAPAAFDSGNFIRDANARRAVFETHRYPEARLEARVLRAAPEGDTAQLTLAGTLTLHGVRRPVRLLAQLERQGDGFAASGAFTLRLSDFGMTRPSFLGVTVFDEVEVSFALSGAPTP